jgi:hypothetical protein
MAQFTTNVPVAQNDPVVTVDVEGLAAGLNRFQLVVVDDSGNESGAVILDVIVSDMDRPTAVLDLVDANGVRIDSGIVPAGQPFTLSAARSSDVAPGKVVEYRFTLMPRN